MVQNFLEISLAFVTITGLQVIARQRRASFSSTVIQEEILTYLAWVHVRV